MCDVSRDLDCAQSFIDRAAAINAKADTDRMSTVRAINYAIVVVWVFGIAAVAGYYAEQAQKHVDLVNQEQVAFK